MFQYDKVFCNIISQNFDAVYSIFMINTYFTIGKAKKDRPETEIDGTVGRNGRMYSKRIISRAGCRHKPQLPSWR